MKDGPVHVYLTTELFYPELPGGLMRFFRYGPGFVTRGIVPHVLTLRHETSLEDEEEVNGIRIHRLTPPPSLSGAQLRSWLLKQASIRASEFIREGGIAVLQPASYSHLMAFTLLAARFRGLPSLHNITIAPEGPLLPKGFRRWRRCLVMSAVRVPVNRFVFLSRQMCRLYGERWKLRPSQIQVIPNGVDLDRFFPVRDETEHKELREKLGFAENQKVVLFVGGVMARKGVDILLCSWDRVHREHPDAILVILGSKGGRLSHQRPGYEEKLEAYIRQIEVLHSRLPVPESVVFAGEVDDPAPYYRMADLFAFPSRHEGLPNVVLEAMASGLPSLVARFEGVPADGEELGFVGRHHLSLGHDAEEWALELVRLLDDKENNHRREIGREAREWVENHHKLSTILDQWASLYREVAGVSVI